MGTSPQDKSLLFRWGFAILILAALALFAVESYRFGNEEMLFLLIGLLSCLLISGILSGIACLSFRKVAPLSLSRPESGNTRYEGGRVSSFWLGLLAQARIRWVSDNDAPLPVDVSLARGREYLKFNTRLIASSITREISITDWTGLFHWKMRGLIPGKVVVDPPIRTARLNRDFFSGSEGDLESPSGVAAGDVTDARYYQGGDSVRRILWSVVAKQGGLAHAGQHLMVRTEEKVTSRRIALFFFPGGPNDDLAAGFARGCVEKDLLGKDWVFSTSVLGVKRPLHRQQGKQKMVLESIDATGGAGAPPLETSLSELKRFARRIKQEGIGKTFVILDESLLKGEGMIRKLTALAPDALFLAISGQSQGTVSYPRAIRRVEVQQA